MREFNEVKVRQNELEDRNFGGGRNGFVMPIGGDIIVNDPHSEFIYVQTIIPDEGGYAIDAYASMINYHESEGGPRFYGRGNFLFSSTPRLATAAELNLLNQIQTNEGIHYIADRTRFEHVISRTVGGVYWFVNDKLVKQAATDDGSEIHQQRLNAKNYFPDKRSGLAETLAKETRNQAAVVRVVE